MKWSWRIARIRGADVNLHVTFGIFLVWIAAASLQRGGSGQDALNGVLFTLAVFASVLLHEFGHIIMAQRFGVRTRRVTLLPIGGVAELERMPQQPRQELLVTLAGPAVNVAIAAALGIYLAATGAEMVVTDATWFARGHELARLMWVNVSLVVFNLIPAFPMDGGRMLRALLAMRRGYLPATRTAAAVGQVIALFLGFIGLFGNPFLVFIALFVWIGAAAEAAAAQTKASLEGVPSSAAMQADVTTLRDTDLLGTAADRLLAGAQPDFPVADAGGALVGVLMREQLIRGLRRFGADGLVANAMSHEVASVAPTEPLEHVVEQMQQGGSRVVAVTDHGHLVGMVTAENVAEFLMIKGALHPQAVSARAGR